jgi:multicomponent Na+:H+ antiporter subunit A
VNETADRVTGVSQPGSLPIYAGVILVTAAALPIWGLVARGSWPGWPAFVDTPAQIPVVAALLGAALAASVVRRRFSAALFLGAAGYAMSALFVVQGAPDLALTQAAMETLSTVLFVLVLRRLPDRFTWAPETGGSTLRDKVRRRLDERNEDGSPVDSPMTARTRMLRVLAAVCVGGAVFVLAIAMSGEPKPSTVTAPTASGLPPAADEMVERSLPDGHGRNVVNVTLVDFRGFDTLGEITVLACAAIGTVALARSGRRPARRRDAQRTALRRGAASFEPPSIVTTSLAGPSASSAGVEAPPGAVRPTAASGGPARLGHLVVLDVAVRIVFAAVMVGSIYLLFAGHNQPGGGFVGGILAGAAVSLRYVAGGIDAVRSLSRARPWTVLGAGLVLSVSTALVPILLGHPVLTSAYRSFDVPVLGSVSLTSVMVFDLGVYLVVLALALMMFESFGDDLVDEQPDDRTPLPTPAPPAPGTDAAAPHRFVARNRPVSGRPRAHSHVGAAEVTP